MPSPVATVALERELDLACAAGALVGYELEADTDRRAGTFRWFTLHLPGGRSVRYGPKSVEAFCLAVRIMADQADDERDTG